MEGKVSGSSDRKPLFKVPGSGDSYDVPDYNVDGLTIGTRAMDVFLKKDSKSDLLKKDQLLCGKPMSSTDDSVLLSEKLRDNKETVNVNIHTKDYSVDGLTKGTHAMDVFLKKDSKSDLLKEFQLLCGKPMYSTDDSVLLSEKLQDYIETVNVNIHTKEPYIEIAEFVTTEYITKLEEEFGVVIEAKGSNVQAPGYGSTDVFRDKDTKLQVEDNDNEFSVSYALQNITEFRCDAIVNSTYPDLNFEDGILAQEIGIAGGEELQAECAKHVQEYGDLKLGQIFVSGPGNLSMKHVFHVASPIWEIDGGKHETNKYIVGIVKKVLQIADEYLLRKIALPAISAGGFGFPMEVSLMSIFSAVNEYFTTRKQSGNRHVLRDVCLVDNNPDIVDVITSAMKKSFGALVKSPNEKLIENNSVINFVITSEKNSGENIGEIVNRIQEHCEGIVGEVQNVCPAWSPMHKSEIYRLDKLAPNSTDYIQLSEIFRKTVHNTDIVKIERVQNRHLYRELLDNREVLRDHIGRWNSDMEMKVWHGTSAESAGNIKRDGFDRKYCGKELPSDYGRGLYFGHTAFVSNMYAAEIMNNTWKGDLMYMFRCTVLLGNKHEVSGKKMGKKYHLPIGKHSLYWKRYAEKDNPLKDVHEIVIYRNTQVYPDYLITYKAKKD